MLEIKTTLQMGATTEDFIKSQAMQFFFEKLPNTAVFAYEKLTQSHVLPEGFEVRELYKNMTFDGLLEQIDGYIAEQIETVDHALKNLQFSIKAVS